MRLAQGTGMTIKPIRTMMNHATTRSFLRRSARAGENLIGEEGKGFRYILDGMNAERILIAAECIGDANWFIAKATAYAKERLVFGRPIGQNQGIQFPIARAYAQMRAAELMVHEAARPTKPARDFGAEANMAKLLAAEASWAAADMCIQTRRLRLRRGIRRRAQIPRDAALPGRADLDQPDPVLPGRARARPAAVVLKWLCRSKASSSSRSNRPSRRRNAPAGWPTPARA